MKCGLKLYAYGTIIPDLRTLVYGDTISPGTFDSFPDDLFRFDSFLSGCIPETETRRAAETLSHIYATRPINEPLLRFIEEVHRLDGEIGLIVTAPSVLDGYRELFPPFVECFYAANDATIARPVGGIVVSRQMRHVERAITAGNPAIHFETAGRLRRELELRGLMVPLEERPKTHEWRR